MHPDATNSIRPLPKTLVSHILAALQSWFQSSSFRHWQGWCCLGMCHISTMDSLLQALQAGGASHRRRPWGHCRTGHRNCFIWEAAVCLVVFDESNRSCVRYTRGKGRAACRHFCEQLKSYSSYCPHALICYIHHADQIELSIYSHTVCMNVRLCPVWTPHLKVFVLLKR